jgi:hypothetical protein
MADDTFYNNTSQVVGYIVYRSRVVGAALKTQEVGELFDEGGAAKQAIIHAGRHQIACQLHTLASSTRSWVARISQTFTWGSITASTAPRTAWTCTQQSVYPRRRSPRSHS